MKKYNEIKIIHKGKFGVFAHDMYKYSAEEYANGFITAFDDFAEAYKLACETKHRAIHIIL